MMKVNSKGEFKAKGEKITLKEQLDKLRTFTKGLDTDYVLCKKEWHMDIIVIPIKCRIDEKEPIIKAKINNPDDRAFQDIVFDEKSKAWYGLSVYAMFLDRNIVDNEYSTYKRELTREYPLSAFKEFLSKNDLTIVNEDYRTYDNVDEFIGFATEIKRSELPDAAKYVYQNIEISFQGASAKEQIYRINGNKMNEYIYFMHECKSVSANAIWDEYSSFKPFLTKNGCHKLMFDKVKGQLSFTHPYKTEEGITEQVYSINIRQSGKDTVYVLNDGSVFHVKDGLKEYLSSKLSHNALDYDFGLWFDGDINEMNRFMDALEDNKKNLKKETKDNGLLLNFG